MMVEWLWKLMGRYIILRKYCLYLLVYNLVDGYKALSSALHKCQYCMAVDEDIQSKVSLVSVCH